MDHSRPSEQSETAQTKAEHKQPVEQVVETQRDWNSLLESVGATQDTAAFHALYSHFSPKIKAFYVSQGLASHADELMHEVFLKVWQKAHTYKAERGNVSAWLFTLVRNQRIELYRRDKLGLQTKNIASDPEELGTLAADDELQEVSLDHSRITALFKHLNIEQRNVLQKVYFEDKSHQHAAQELEMTVGMVKSRIRSALKVLRHHLSGEAK